MHIADVKVPSNWVKLEDLISTGRTTYKILEEKNYYIHNYSGHTLYLAEASSVDSISEEVRIYAGKSAGYEKSGSGDLYVCSKLSEVYPNPEFISITFCDDVRATAAIPVGEYKPALETVKGAYVFRGSVESKKDLPSEAEVGDVYNVKDSSMNYAWTGSEWDELGAIIDLSGYALKTDLPTKNSQLENDSLYVNKEELTEALAPKAEVADLVALQAEVEANTASIEKAATAILDSLELKADKTELEPLATKDYVDAAVSGVDHSTYATKEEVAVLDTKIDSNFEALEKSISTNKVELEDSIALKADKTELEPLATKAELEAAIAGVDHSSYATKEELKEGLAGKTESLIEGPNGKAKVFNETSGGGAQFVNTVKNTLSFVGVNDGNDGVFVQIYSKDSKTNVGARLNAAPTGIYYTNGKTNGSYEEGNEIATKADLDEAIAGVDHTAFATKDQVEVVDASVASVLARMNVLEERMSDISKTEVEAVVVEGTAPAMNDETKDYVVKGNITAPATISGKSITMKDVQIDNLAKVVGTAQGDVDIKGMAIQGEYPESPANVILDFAADGYVTIKDTEFNVGTYNAINIGLRQPGPKGVLIDGVDFRGKCRNNAISVYSTQEHAVININNCYFEDVSNAIRICNSTNTSCTVNITNCRCDKWEENLRYTGMFLLEDIVSKSAEEVAANNFFGNGKVVINISNFILPNGEKLVAQDLAGICGTQDENQIFYVHDNYNKVRPYSEEVYPVINIV